MNYESLKAKCYTSPGIFYPDNTQNIANIKQILVYLAGGDYPKFSVRESFFPQGASNRAQNIIVLAIDSVSYKIFHACHDKLTAVPSVTTALTSTFPSTSVVSWSSIIQGVPPTEHAIYGPVFYHEEFDRVITILRDAIYITNWDKVPIPNPCQYSLGLPTPTLFEELATLGWTSYFLCDRGLAGAKSWAYRYLSGAKVVANFFDIQCYFDIKRLLAKCLDLTEQVIGQINNSGNLIWTFINLDPLVHETGFTHSEQEYFWSTISLFINRISSHSKPFTIVLLSDHGQITQEADRECVSKFNELVDNPNLFRLPFGGAGRVRWVYPKPNKVDTVYELFTSIIGEYGNVMYRDDLESSGFFHGLPITQKTRLGEVVMIAASPRFPSFGHTLRAEHGSASEDEMFVPFLVFE